MQQFSTELLLKCFPNQQTILSYMDEILEINKNPDSIRHIKQCKKNLEDGLYRVARAEAQQALYNLLAQAIEYHYE